MYLREKDSNTFSGFQCIRPGCWLYVRPCRSEMMINGSFSTKLDLTCHKRLPLVGNNHPVTGDKWNSLWPGLQSFNLSSDFSLI